MTTIISIISFYLEKQSDNIYSDISELVLDLQVIIDSYDDMPNEDKYISGSVTSYYDDISCTYVTDGILYDDIAETIDLSTKLQRLL
jgi:hypothetical protein